MTKLLFAAFAAAVAFCTPAFAVAQSDIGKQRAAEIADLCKLKGMEYIPHNEADIKRLGTMAGREFEQAKKFSCIVSAKTQRLPGNAKRASFDARPLVKNLPRIVHDVFGRKNRRPDNRRPNTRRPDENRFTSDTAKIRAYLDEYKGPLWKESGPRRNVYMNKKAPADAVPCQPKGYDHVVLCRDRSPKPSP